MPLARFSRPATATRARALTKLAPMRAATLHARRPAARGARAAAEAAPAPQAPPAAVTKLSLAGPPPQRFAVGKGQLLSIATAALGTVLRGGVGALAYGFSASLLRDDPAAAASYAVVAGVAGRRLAESSAVASFPRPAAPIVLYEFTACPFCRKVRDACSVLDLDVEFRPTPRDGARFRPKAAARSGKAQFPFMVDPNTGKEMLESDDIIGENFIYIYNSYIYNSPSPPNFTRQSLTHSPTPLAAQSTSSTRTAPARRTYPASSSAARSRR
jgi:hypothetical protein